MLLKRQKQKSFIDFVSSKLLLGPHEPKLAFKKVRACMKVVSQKKSLFMMALDLISTIQAFM